MNHQVKILTFKHLRTGSGCYHISAWRPGSQLNDEADFELLVRTLEHIEELAPPSVTPTERAAALSYLTAIMCGS